MPDDPKQITEEHVRDATMGMRVQRLTPTSVNSYLRVLKAWLRWMKIPGADGVPIPVPFLQAPRLVPRTFTAAQQRALLAAKPTSMSGQRVLLLAKIYLDTGARAEEIIQLFMGDINLDDQLIKIEGKGSRERIIPFSRELRGDLHRWIEQFPDASQDSWLFPTERGHISYRNMHRDFVALCKSVRISGRRMSFHSLRHTFATSYVANGGDPLRLQRVLGHTNLQMTSRYVQTQTRDLSVVHERFSPLGSAQGKDGKKR